MDNKPRHKKHGTNDYTGQLPTGVLLVIIMAAATAAAYIGTAVFLALMAGAAVIVTAAIIVVAGAAVAMAAAILIAAGANLFGRLMLCMFVAAAAAGFISGHQITASGNI